MAKTESLQKDSLGRDSIKQAAEITCKASHTAIRKWTERWNDDVEGPISRCLMEVFAERSIDADSEAFIVDNSPPAKTAADRNNGDPVRAMANSNHRRNAFFAVVDQAHRLCLKHG